MKSLLKYTFQRRFSHFETVSNFRSQLENRSNVPLVGMMIHFTDQMSTDALCNCCDFLWYDMEHTPFSPEVLRNHLMVAKHRNTTSVVRIPAPNYTTENIAAIHGTYAKHILDSNAAGIILPQIRNHKEIEEFILECKYPCYGPGYRRGFGPTIPTNYGRYNIDEYVKNANEKLLIGVTIETKEAVANIDDICRVNELDFIVIGCMDLTGSHGVPYSVSYKDDGLKKVIDKIINSAKKHKKYVMYASVSHRDVDFAKEVVSNGVDMILCTNDVMAAVDYQTDLTKQLKGNCNQNIK